MHPINKGLDEADFFHDIIPRLGVDGGNYFNVLIHKPCSGSMNPQSRIELLKILLLDLLNFLQAPDMPPLSRERRLEECFYNLAHLLWGRPVRSNSNRVRIVMCTGVP